MGKRTKARVSDERWEDEDEEFGEFLDGSCSPSDESLHECCMMKVDTTLNYCMLKLDLCERSDSPADSSSSDDFASFLDAELNSSESDSSCEDDDEDYSVLDLESDKRRKVEISDGVITRAVTLRNSSQEKSGEVLGGSSSKNTCSHPGVFAGMCVACGKKIGDEFGVRLEYIHKNLRLANDEIAQVRGKHLKNLLCSKKLSLLLDLDHTLLNSAQLADLTIEEGYLNGQRDSLPDNLKSSLFRLHGMQMMTKLRPSVHTLLREANDLFELYIYTMGERPYALAMANLLDPGGVYFNSRIIARGDSTQRHQKGLDVVLAQESAVIILDDTESVWGKHKDNLILMERYHYFASSCKHFGFKCKSLSELQCDESETEGVLDSVLKILKRIHSFFFDEERKDKPEDRDVRQVMKTIRKEVLKDCKVVFSRVFPTNSTPEHHPLWKMAEQLGATCLRELDPSVTHVVSMDAGTDKSRWAVRKKKHLVHPRWIEASMYMWLKQCEENFPVSRSKNTTNFMSNL